MGLNIVANRKMSLKGFAEGWDNCYLIVRGVNESRRLELSDELDKKAASEHDLESLMKDICLEVITGGVVMTTEDDGTTRSVTLSSEDIPTMVDALNFSWRQEVSSVATGQNRLKAMMN